jgi:hypothetical protein
MSNNGNLVNEVHYSNMYRKALVWNEEEQVYNDSVTFLVDEGIGGKVIRNDRAIIVMLDDGSKGTAVCSPMDEYDSRKGLRIAYARAMAQHFKKVANQLAYQE